MKQLLDTSVLVAAIVTAHPKHRMAEAALRAIQRGEHQGFVCLHTVAELYAVLTTLPLRPAIKPAEARQLIEQTVLKLLDVVELDTSDYRALIEQLAARELIGGMTYDGLIAHAAIKANVDRVVTLNAAHFRRVVPDAIDVTTPEP